MTGHRTELIENSIVIITSIVVAASAAAISTKFSSFSYVGGIVGSSVSAAFLLLLGAANAYILYLIIKQLRKLLHAQRNGPEITETFKLEGAGFFFRVFKRLFKLIDRPWKMYPRKSYQRSNKVSCPGQISRSTSRHPVITPNTLLMEQIKSASCLAWDSIPPPKSHYSAFPPFKPRVVPHFGSSLSSRSYSQPACVFWIRWTGP